MPDSRTAQKSSLNPQNTGLEARASKEDHQSLRLWLRLLSCSTEIETEIRRRLRGNFDMSLARFDYMAQLHRYPDGLTMRMLSRHLMVTGGNVTGLTDELENEGFVVREASAEDRRSYLVKLTPVGRTRFEQIASVHEGWVVELFAGLKASERGELNELLGRLRVHLAKALNGEPTTPAKTGAFRRPRKA
jgi:DNA-binding MarR family transcriptional regulator